MGSAAVLTTSADYAFTPNVGQAILLVIMLAITSCLRRHWPY